jgi:hypothetical protein
MRSFCFQQGHTDVVRALIVFGIDVNGQLNGTTDSRQHKCKFRRLKMLDMLLSDSIPMVIQSACVLHNFILEMGLVDDDVIVNDKDAPDPEQEEATDGAHDRILCNPGCAEMK